VENGNPVAPSTTDGDSHVVLLGDSIVANAAYTLGAPVSSPTCGRATIARLGLTMFNDVIQRTAMELGLDALELRAICTEPADYANPIEPSDRGGLTIARAIARAVGAARGADVRAVRL
jgi:hypothetical protein